MNNLGIMFGTAANTYYQKQQQEKEQQRLQEMADWQRTWQEKQFEQNQTEWAFKNKQMQDEADRKAKIEEFNTGLASAIASGDPKAGLKFMIDNPGMLDTQTLVDVGNRYNAPPPEMFDSTKYNFTPENPWVKGNMTSDDVNAAVKWEQDKRDYEYKVQNDAANRSIDWARVNKSDGGSDSGMSPEDKRFMEQTNKDYNSWFKGTWDSSQRNKYWSIDQYMRKYRPNDYGRWKQLNGGNYSVPSSTKTTNPKPTKTNNSTTNDQQKKDYEVGVKIAKNGTSAEKRQWATYYYKTYGKKHPNL